MGYTEYLDEKGTMLNYLRRVVGKLKKDAVSRDEKQWEDKYDMRGEEEKMVHKLQFKIEEIETEYPESWYKNHEIVHTASTRVGDRYKKILYPYIINMICLYIDDISKISLLVCFGYYREAREILQTKRKTLIRYTYFDKVRTIPALCFNVRDLAEKHKDDILLWLSKFLETDESVGSILYEGILSPEVFKAFHPSLVEMCVKNMHPMDNRLTPAFYGLNPSEAMLRYTLVRMLSINDVMRVRIIKERMDDFGFRITPLSFSDYGMIGISSPTASTMNYLWNTLTFDEKCCISTDKGIDSKYIDPMIRENLIRRSVELRCITVIPKHKGYVPPEYIEEKGNTFLDDLK